MNITARILLALCAIVWLLALAAPGIGGGKKVMTSDVTVLDDKGKHAGRRQVILEYDSSKGPVYTDAVVTSAGGVAKVKHGQEGKVKVWVDGDYSSHITTGVVPGKITVRLGGLAPYMIIDRHALKATAEAERTVDTLAKYLAEPAKNDLDKVRAIFRWITDRVAFDEEQRLSGKTGTVTSEMVLKDRKCDCEGYTALFKSLAKKMDLEAATVVGYSRRGNRHGWNAVKIDGEWKLFDATWGAGLIIDKKWEKRTNEYYFQTPPQMLLFSHFPDDSKWQFRTPPCTKEEFDACPQVPPRIFAMGVGAERVRKMVAEEKVKQFCEFFNPLGETAILWDGPVTMTLKAGMKYRFQVEAADLSKVAIQNGGQFMPFQKKGPLHEGIIAPRQGPLIVLFSSSLNQGTYKGIVRYEVE